MGLSFTKHFSRMFAKEMHILMLGLGGAGKTTILYKLKLGKTVTTTVTVGFNVETVEYKNINFTIYDVGGQTQAIPLIRNFFPLIQGVIFVIDSDDQNWIFYAKDNLHRVLNENGLEDVLLLVYANKQDLPNAMTAEEITNKFDLHSLRQRKWFIQSTCAINGEGIHEGLDWLSNNIADK